MHDLEAFLDLHRVDFGQLTGKVGQGVVVGADHRGQTVTFVGQLLVLDGELGLLLLQPVDLPLENLDGLQDEGVLVHLAGRYLPRP